MEATVVQEIEELMQVGLAQLEPEWLRFQSCLSATSCQKAKLKISVYISHPHYDKNDQPASLKKCEDSRTAKDRSDETAHFEPITKI